MRLQRRRGARIAEVGAGNLRSALHLLAQDFSVTVIELEETRDRFVEAYERFAANGGRLILSSYTRHTAFRGRDRRASYLRLPRAEKFDFVLCTFVIETICDPDERIRLLRAIRQHLARDGALILSVRGRSDVVTAWAKGRRCSDGYLTPQRTFIRSHSRRQLADLLTLAGFGRMEFLHKPETKTPELLHVIAEA